MLTRSRKLIKSFLNNANGASLAEFAVVTAMMATFVSTSVPKFSEVMELEKERKTIEELDKIVIQGMSFYNETVKTEGRGRFPGQDKYNMAVGGYTDIENLIFDLELFEVGNDPNYARNGYQFLAYLIRKHLFQWKQNFKMIS